MNLVPFNRVKHSPVELNSKPTAPGEVARPGVLAERGRTNLALNISCADVLASI